jgi:hypothetical protein
VRKIKNGPLTPFLSLSKLLPKQLHRPPAIGGFDARTLHAVTSFKVDPCPNGAAEFPNALGQKPTFGFRLVMGAPSHNRFLSASFLQV